MTPKSSFR